MATFATREQMPRNRVMIARPAPDRRTVLAVLATGVLAPRAALSATAPATAPKAWSLGDLHALSPSLRLVDPSGDRSGGADTRALQASLDLGGVTLLKAGGRYHLRNRLRLSHGASGLACPGGMADLVMLTGAGQFSLSAYEPSEQFGDHHVAIHAEGVARPILDGLRVTLAGAETPCVAIPFALRGCSDLRIGRLEYTGFRETWRGMLTLDSCHGGRIDHLYCHDCTPNTDVLPSLQVSAVVLDDNRLDGASSRDIHFGLVRYANLLLGPRAMARYGPQSDAVTVMSDGGGGLVFDLITGDGVGEVLDCWGDGVTASIKARDTQLYPVKLMYGAEHCVIAADVDRTGLSAVYLSGNADGPWRRRQGVAHNRVRVQATNVGALHDEVAAIWRPMPPMQPGVYLDGPGLAHAPEDNHVSGQVFGAPGAGMPYVIGASASGPGNVLELGGGGFVRGFSSGAGSLRTPPAIRRL